MMIGNVRAMVMAVEQRFLLTVGQEGVKCWVTTMPQQDEQAAWPCGSLGTLPQHEEIIVNL